MKIKREEGGNPRFRKRPSASRTGALTLAECALCADEMSEPKTLRCGHNLCAGCVEWEQRMRSVVANDPKTRRNHFIEQGPLVVCVECGLTTMVPSGGLPTNAALKGLIEQLKKARDEKEEQSESVARCYICGKCSRQLYMCADCRRNGMLDSVHICADCALKSTHRHHRIEPIDGISAEQAEKIGRQSRAIRTDFARDCQQVRDKAVGEIDKVLAAQRAKLGKVADEVEELCEIRHGGMVLKSEAESGLEKLKAASATEKKKLSDFATNLGNSAARYAREAKKGQ